MNVGSFLVCLQYYIGYLSTKICCLKFKTNNRAFQVCKTDYNMLVKHICLVNLNSYMLLFESYFLFSKFPSRLDEIEFENYFLGLSTGSWWLKSSFCIHQDPIRAPFYIPAALLLLQLHEHGLGK